MVLSFKGDPVKAKVTIKPIGVTVETDDEGYFEVDVAPGKYKVIFEAPGFKRQKRRATVGEKEVNIINVDMRPKR